MADLVILKHNGGNMRSVYYAFKRKNVNPILSDDPNIIHNAKRLVFPGQGNAEKVMEYLKQKELDSVLKNYKNPFLGICVGLQVMCASSQECKPDNDECLGIFPYRVKKLPTNTVNSVPHIGWNNLEDCSGTLTKGLPNKHLYYIHSYYCEVGKETVAKTSYINDFSASLEKDNFFAFQGHLEKSGYIGEKIIENFLSL